MAQYNFEGDIDNISERQLQFIHDVILKLGFENSKVSFEPVGKAGDNYVACVKRIIIEGDNGGLSMIAKIAPTNEVFRQLMNSFLLFRNEHIMYSEVLPKFMQLQNEAEIPKEDQLKYAKCYGSLSEAPNEVILLEDLKTSEFIMLDRFESLHDEHIRSVLKNFALLHSMSFVLRHKEPETFENFKSNLKDMWLSMDSDEHMKFYFQTLENDTLTILKEPDHLNFLRHKISDTLEIAMKLTKADKDSKYTVIQQGDSWSNNIMFRFEDGKLAESIMIDYQLSKHSSPAYDIMYMIFGCTNHEIRKQYYYEWIDYYHSELGKALSNYDLKVNFVYPRDKLDTDMKRYGKLMFGLSVVVASMLIRKSDDAAKIMEVMNNDGVNMMEKSQEFNVSHLDEESINRFKNKIIGFIDSFTEFGLL